MVNILGYYVYNSETKQWLDEDNNFTSFFYRAKEFSDFIEADAEMKRNCADYVFACMGSI